MNAEIKHLDIISVMKVCSVVYAVIGLVLGLIVLILTLVSTSFVGLGLGVGSGAFSRLASVGLGVLMVPLLAVVYGCIGAVGGLVFTVLYNVVSQTVGGIKVTLSGIGIGRGLSDTESGTEVRL